MKTPPERRDVPPERLAGLRYTFVEDRNQLGPYFCILDRKTSFAYAVSRAAALKIVRALNREDLRVFASRAKRARPAVGATGPVARQSPPQRRLRSKRKIY